MSKLGNIAIGWGKKLGIFHTSEAEAALSDLRLKICAECPLHKVSRALKLLEGRDEAEYVNTIYCTRCKCPSSAKSLVVRESCPEGRW